MPVPVHPLQNLLQFSERYITLLLRGTPELLLNDRAEEKKLGVLFLVSMAHNQQDQANYNDY